MKNSLFFAVVLFLLLCNLGTAQRGTAENGFWPMDYHGDTFTGKVTSAADDDTLTLTYERKNRKEEFVGKLEGGCVVPSKDGSLMHAKDIPDSSVTAYYKVVSMKIGDQKKKENIIFAIKFVQVNGKPLSDDKRKLFWCSASKKGS